DALQQAAVAPGVEVALHRGEGRELRRQRAPLDAGPGNVKDRLDNDAQTSLARPPVTMGTRQQRLQPFPFAIRHIARKPAAQTPILIPSGLAPGHRDLLRIFANPMESQPSQITHLFFGQALRMREGCASLPQAGGSKIVEVRPSRLGLRPRTSESGPKLVGDPGLV